jgi:predicted ABC-type ATPase
MATLYVTRGLPGCGKTTRALAWVAEDPAGRARVNRDSLRAMAHDSVHLGRDTERQIMAVRDAAIGVLLRQGVDVVCDDTNLPSRTVKDLRRVADSARAGFEVWDMTDVSPDVCVERDAARTGRAHVGEEVIRDLYARFIAGRRCPLPLVEVPAAAAVVDLYRPVAGTPVAVLVDIDGTVALLGDRSPYDESRVHLDLPNLSVIAAVRAMHAAGHAIVFCSGRTDGCRDATEQWLDMYVGVPYAALYMREIGDTRRDSIVKGEIFDRHIRTQWTVACVFDDRQQVVDMWRALGLTVMQVAPGDF